MKKSIKSTAGFTFIEMMIVIAIIGVLLAVLAVSLTGGTDRARAIKCATNIKNLAAGVSSAIVAQNGVFPFAQSALCMGNDIENGNDVGVGYNVCKGWISYLDQNVKYPKTSEEGYAQCSLAARDPEDIRHALTNGAIWKAVGENPDVYVCPTFRDAVRERGIHKPGWSYHMNAFFGYEDKPGKVTHEQGGGVKLIDLKNADRRLLLAEIQGLTLVKPKVRRLGVPLPNVDLESLTDTDCCLWYKSKGGNESIGFNHVDGTMIFGHVAFADGHVEKIVAPKGGNFVDLTNWLCRGQDVTFEGENYKEVPEPNLD